MIAPDLVHVQAKEFGDLLGREAAAQLGGQYREVFNAEIGHLNLS